jgi:hypothetical protein
MELEVKRTILETWWHHPVWESIDKFMAQAVDDFPSRVSSLPDDDFSWYYSLSIGATSRISVSLDDQS